MTHLKQYYPLHYMREYHQMLHLKMKPPMYFQ